jgi:CubicO group peptidase (beta-lactamase class C family)
MAWDHGICQIIDNKPRTTKRKETHGLDLRDLGPWLPALCPLPLTPLTPYDLSFDILILPPPDHTTMPRTAFGLAFLVLPTLAGTTFANPPDDPAPTPEQVAALLEPIRARHKLPALAGAIVGPDGAVVVAAVGHRVAGSPEEVTPEDKFHLGSDTKAMTATLLATFVEEGKLSWETTLADALPDLAERMHPDLRKVTIAQLLAHRAGLSGETSAPGLSLGAMRALEGPLPPHRLDYAARVLSERPAYPPGSKFEYANRGYIVAGVIAERLGESSWEDLMRSRIFEPLKMTTAGFGAMASPGQHDQPWPHASMFGVPVPIAPGPLADNPALIGPAGTAHMSLGDWSKFVACHLRAGRGEIALLKPETFATLHAKPDEGEYAYGWVFVERGWAGGTALTHAGSNTLNFCVVWMAPERNFAVLAATNYGGEGAPKACDEVSAALIKLHGEGE